MSARHKPAGWEITSGYETLRKVEPHVWVFTGEDGVRSVHGDFEADELLDTYFPEGDN